MTVARINSHAPYRLIALAFCLLAATGCAPKTYLSPTGKQLVFEEGRSDQAGSIDTSAATRCLEGKTAIYRKLFGESHNPCAELGIFLINNGLPDEGIPLLEHGMRVSPSYNATLSKLDMGQLGILQKTRTANLLFDICLKGGATDLHDDRDITADICARSGELYEKVNYRENAVQMYRKKCELTGRCEELTRLGAPIKR